MHRHTCASLLNMGCDEDTVLIYNNMENNACQKKKGKKERVVSHDRCLLLIAYSFELRSLSELQDIVAALSRWTALRM